MKAFFKWNAIAENSERHFKKCPVTFYNFFFNLYSHQWIRVPFSPHIYWHYLLSLSKIFSHLLGDKSYLAVLNCISLITSEIEIFFTILLSIYDSFFPFSFYDVCHFSIKMFIFFVDLEKFFVLNILAFSYICYKHFHLPFIYLYLKSFCIVYS